MGKVRNPKLTQESHEAFVKRYAKTCLLTRDERAAARSGLHDAAHLCDAMAADMLATRRKSKKLDEALLVLKTTGDAIWAMRDLIVEPEARALAATAPEREP